MLNIEDERMLKEFIKQEQEYPSQQKVMDRDRTIYTSRKFLLPKDDLWGQPVLCDLRQARIGHSHTANTQPNIYKAPEVFFEMS